MAGGVGAARAPARARDRRDECDLELLTIGRISVDLYAEQLGVPLRRRPHVPQVDRRHGHQRRRGGRPLGPACRRVHQGGRRSLRRLRALGARRDLRASTPASSGTDPDLRTPLAFAELDPPDDPRIIFYREPKAPDLNLTLGRHRRASVRGERCRSSGWPPAPSSAEPSRSHRPRPAGASVRERRDQHTVLDLDWRPQLWDAPASATREVGRGRSTSATMAIGNRAECEIAVGTADPARGGGPAAGPGSAPRPSSSWGRRRPGGHGGGPAGAGAAVPGRGGVRSRRRRRLRRRAVPWPAVGLGHRRVRPLRQRRRRHRRRPPDVRRRHADPGRHRGPGGGAPCCWPMTGGRDLLEQRATRAGRRGRARCGRGPAGPLADRRPPVHRRRRPHGPGHARRRRRPLRHGRPPPAPGAPAGRRCAHPGVDGVLGSPDVLEELALLGALDGKLAFGTMNRGGLMGARWELDDRMTAYDAEGIAHGGLDGGKVLLRIADDDAGTAPTLEACAGAVSALARRGLPIMVEPLPYHIDRGRRGQAARRRRQAAAGRRRGRRPSAPRRAYTWLKVPAGPGRGPHAVGHDAAGAASSAARPAPTPRPPTPSWERGDDRAQRAGPGRRAGPCSTRPTATSPGPSRGRPGSCDPERCQDG